MMERFSHNFQAIELTDCRDNRGSIRALFPPRLEEPPLDNVGQGFLVLGADGAELGVVEEGPVGVVGEDGGDAFDRFGPVGFGGLDDGLGAVAPGEEAQCAAGGGALVALGAEDFRPGLRPASTRRNQCAATAAARVLRMGSSARPRQGYSWRFAMAWSASFGPLRASWERMLSSSFQP